ncbi:MAG: AMP-dependent synthetase [Acidobacteria bacterium]|nr:MAG: AMP-dependent synthetase [Acidobacteriota bacterium]
MDPAAPALVAADGTVVDHGTLRRRVDEVAGTLPDATAGRMLVHVPLAPTVEAVVGYLAVLEAGHAALVTSCEPAAAAPVTAAWPVDLALTPAGTFAPATPTPAPRHLVHPDLALLLSTSGSTGSPKLVRLSHRNVTSNASAIAGALGLTASDRGVTSLPLHYCYGLSVLHSHLTVGASVALTTASVLDEEFWSVVDGRGVTDIAVVPHMVELMETTGVLERPHPSLRLLTQAGGRLAPDRVERTARLGAEHGWGLSVMYGQTEATARIAVHEPAAALTAPDAVGRPVPGSTVVLDRSVPEADADAGTGEVVVRGPGVMMGYAEHPDELALGPMLTELRTGDLGRVDDDGVLRVVGRRSGFVKVLGLRIDLARVEAALEREGLVACVTGDDEGLRVAVEPVAGTPATELSGMARRTAAHASGLGVGHVRVAVLPLARLTNGKVDRAGCDVLVRGSAPEECADARQQLDAPSLEVRVGAALGDVLGRDGVDLSRSFVAQGGDSLSHVQASTRLTALLGPLPADWHHRALEDLVHDAVGRGDAAGSGAAPSGRLARWLGAPVRLETSVVLRALAVVMICGTHAGLFRLLGGAHTLLVVAGYNAALFGLSAVTAGGRWRGSGRLLVGVAVPTMVVALVGLSYGRYGWDNVLMANWRVDDISYGKHNELWFIDSLVACVLVTTLVLSVPAVSRRWRADPWPVAFALVVAGLVPRFVILTLADGVLRGMMPTVFWLFAVGLALATARTAARRRWTLGAMVLGIAWFFPDDPVRNATILAGVLALALLPTVRVPSRLVPVVATLAAASLVVYLVQFQVLDLVPTPPLKTLAALAVGVALWRLTERPLRRLTDRLVPPHTSALETRPERTTA